MVAHFVNEEAEAEGGEEEGEAASNSNWDGGGQSSSGGFQETFDHLQQGLSSLLAQHKREVRQLRSENTKLRASFSRVSTHSGMSAVQGFRRSCHSSSFMSEGNPKDAAMQRVSFATSSFAMSDDTSEELDALSADSICVEEPDQRSPALASMQSQTPASGGDAMDIDNSFFAAKSPQSEGSPPADSVEDKGFLDGDASVALSCAEGKQPRQYGRGLKYMSTRSRFSAKRLQKNSVFTRIVTSQFFEFFFGFFILLNCASMGLEAEFLVAGGTPATETMLEVSEHVFTLVFLVELLLRAKVYGWRSYLPTTSIYNFFDAMLVLVTGVLFAWVWPLYLRISGTKGQEGALRVLTVLRAFRLARLARVVRNIESFSEAWVLIRGLTNSVRTLVWTIVVIFILAYTFAVFGLALMGKEFVRQYNQAETGSVQEAELALLVGYTGKMDRLLFTLIQLLTQDNWSDVVRLSVKYLVWSWIYFYSYLGVVVIVLMNLVTAIIVENALLTSKMDEDKQLAQKEQQKKQELNKLKQIFLMMDLDGDGTLSWHEFEAAFKQEDILNKWKLLDFQPDECMDLFKLLDRGDGCIPLTDFHDGLLRMKGVAQSKDLYQVMRYLDDLSIVVSEIAEKTVHADRGPRERRKTIFGELLPAQEESAAVQAAPVAKADRAPRARKKERSDTVDDSYVL